MKIDNIGTIKINKGVIFKIDHKTYSPYSFVRKEAIITNDEGSFYQLIKTNVFL